MTKQITAAIMAICLLAASCTGAGSPDDEAVALTAQTSTSTTIEPVEEAPVDTEPDDSSAQEDSYGTRGEIHIHEDGFAHTHGAGAPQEWVVIYNSDGEFEPARIDILAGDTVIFKNESEWGVWPASNIHPTHEILPEFDPLEPIPPGESWSHTFTDNGYWRYHNHELASEIGMIVVTGETDEYSALEIENDLSDLEFLPVPADIDADLILNDETVLREFVLAYGPVATVAFLSDYEIRTTVSCHNAAHVVGRFAYEEYGPAAFNVATHQCSTGILHGVLEAMFAERGTATLAEDVTAICLAKNNSLYQSNCWHGVGHGLMAWTSYEIHDALELCDIAKPVNERACYSGVFMENVVGGMENLTGHSSDYINDFDLHFPCTVLKEEYVAPCYSYQPVHMLEVLHSDYSAVIFECSEVDEKYRHNCFQAIGATVGGNLGRQPATAAHTCGLVPDDEFYQICVGGIIHELFWEPAEAPFAVAVCNSIPDRAGANTCWKETASRAIDIFITHEEREYLCTLFAVGGREQYCREYFLLDILAP